MKWSRILIIFVVLLLVGGIAFLAASVHLRLTSAEYQFQVDAVLAAAKVANGEEPVADPARSVVAEYEGKRWVVVPGNYLALSSFLRKDAFARLFTRPDPERALTLTVCGEDRFTLSPDETGDRVTVMLETQGNTFTVVTKGGNQWTSLLAVCTKGTYHDDNIPLD